MKKSYCGAALLFVFHFTHPLALFEEFNELTWVIPHVSIANLPTPVHRLPHLEEALHHAPIFIKRDDLTGSNGLYGGNKVRKLEFLLGDALQNNATKIIIFGCVGTNHGLATACYARQLGFDCLLMLKHQPNSWVVQQNLLLDHYFKADIRLFKNNEERWVALETLLENDTDAYFFPTGGSVALGAVGYVNAALELKHQIDAGDMPMPNTIYLPVGSCGTTAGLLLGFKIAGIPSTLKAVAVEPEETPNEFYENTKKLFTEANQLLHEALPSIPLYEFPETQLAINKDFCGQEYGLWLPEGDQATEIMYETEGITLEGTYSAKPVAALIADIQNGLLSDHEVALVWNTYCGLDFSALTANVQYKELPSEVHHYFE